MILDSGLLFFGPPCMYTSLTRQTGMLCASIRVQQRDNIGQMQEKYVMQNYTEGT